MTPTPPASEPSAKKCLHCGGNTVRPRKRPGRTVHYKTIAALPLPADLPIPTCSRCQAEYLDEETARQTLESYKQICVDQLATSFSAGDHQAPVLDTKTGKRVWTAKRGMSRIEDCAFVLRPAMGGQRA